MDQIASLNKAHERIEALERENKLLRGTATQSKRIHELWTKSLADLKETRNKLQSSRDFLELLLGTAPLPIFVLSRYGRIMLSNKAGESLLYACDQSVSGQNALRYLISEDRCSLLNALRSDGGQHASSIEVRIEVAGHPGRLLEMYWASLPESTEGLGRVIVVAMDITERKRMEREREQLQKDLVRVSREAGMAEVAAGVLHNVGNALTSLNVSATIASEKIRKFRIAGLRQVVDLFEEKGDGLGEFLAHDQKGRQLPAYLGKLSDNLTQERESIDRVLDSALRDIEHIKRVIATQQSYAFPTTVIEPVQISELLDDAVRMSVSGRHSVKIVREYADVPLVKTDRHALLQVIINP